MGDIGDSDIELGFSQKISENEDQISSSYEVVSSQEFLRRNANTVWKAVQVIKEDSEGSTEVKASLSALLEAREENYFAIAKTIHPDVEKVGDFLYAVPGIDGKKIYGSIIAILDSKPEVTSHISLAAALQFSQAERTESLMAEDVTSAIDSSMVVLSGSGAQQRIHAYPSDLDLGEHIRVKADNIEDAASLLAQGIKANVFDSKEIEDSTGKKTRVHFKSIRIGAYPPDVASDFQNIRVMQWTKEDIEAGFKTIPLQDGTTRKITLEEVCKDPRGLRFEYLGLTDDEIFEISKVANIKVESPNGVILDSSATDIAAYREIYFEDPTKFGLLEHITDSDRFVNYVSYNLDQVVQTLGNQNNKRLLPACKRLHSIMKVLGDLEAAQSLAEIFHTDAAKIKQMLSRYRPIKEAVDEGLVGGEAQRTYMADLWNLCLKYPNEWSNSYTNKYTQKGFLNDRDIRGLAISLSDNKIKDFIKNSSAGSRIQQLLPRGIFI